MRRTSLRSTRRRPQRPSFTLDGDNLGRLPRRSRGFREVLRHHLLAAERNDEHGAHVRMLTVGRERLVRDGQIGTQLASSFIFGNRANRKRITQLWELFPQ